MTKTQDLWLRYLMVLGLFLLLLLLFGPALLGFFQDSVNGYPFWRGVFMFAIGCFLAWIVFVRLKK